MAHLACASRLCRAGRATARPCAVRDARVSRPRSFGLADKGLRYSDAPYGDLKKPNTTFMSQLDPRPKTPEYGLVPIYVAQSFKLYIKTETEFKFGGTNMEGRYRFWPSFF